MGGLGSGGRRPGAGRKPKCAEARALDGHASHSAKVVPHPSAALGPSKTTGPSKRFRPPKDFTPDARAVWAELAPHAFENGTLTKATALSFRLLCWNIVLERRYAGSVNDAGTANHRGMIQRIDAELLRFNLSPCGKAIAKPTAASAVDPMKAKYFGLSGGRGGRSA